MAWIDDIHRVQRLEKILNPLLEIKGETPIHKAKEIVDTAITQYRHYIETEKRKKENPQ